MKSVIHSESIPTRILVLWNQGLDPRSKQINEDAQSLVGERLASLLTGGSYYWYVFAPAQGEFLHVSNGVTELLGYQPEELTPRLIVESIHPDDLPWMLVFENTVVSFFGSLPTGKMKRFKVRYDYRLRRKDGNYVRILQQVVTFTHDSAGKFLSTLGSHTDITDLKSDTKMTLSFIGLDGEPSYVDVDLDFRGLQDLRIKFTKRERQILSQISEGKTSAEAGKELGISGETINTYRRKLLKKAKVGNVAELIRFSVQNGLV